ALPALHVSSSRADAFVLAPLRVVGAARFPYTTLFRSLHRIVRRLAHRRRAAIAEVRQLVAHRYRRRQRRTHREVAAPVAAPDHRDRKSTRLNSSHVKTSYAVFCLKKDARLEVEENLRG